MSNYWNTENNGSQLMNIARDEKININDFIFNWIKAVKITLIEFSLSRRMFNMCIC